MLAGIRDMPHHLDAVTICPRFERLLGDGSQWGIAISYAVQPQARRPRPSLSDRRDFIDGKACCARSRRQYFFGHGLTEQLRRRRSERRVAHRVRLSGARSRADTASWRSTRRPRRLDRGEAEAAEVALGGDRALFLRRDVVEIAREVRPSGARRTGNHDDQQRLSRSRPTDVEKMGRGYAWLDTGTHESLLDAANFVEPSN